MVLKGGVFANMDCLRFDGKYRFWCFERVEFIFLYNYNKKDMDIGHYFFDINLN